MRKIFNMKNFFIFIISFIFVCLILLFKSSITNAKDVPFSFIENFETKGNKSLYEIIETIEINISEGNQIKFNSSVNKGDTLIFSFNNINNIMSFSLYESQNNYMNNVGNASIYGNSAIKVKVNSDYSFKCEFGYPSESKNKEKNSEDAKIISGTLNIYKKIR